MPASGTSSSRIFSHFKMISIKDVHESNGASYLRVLTCDVPIARNFRDAMDQGGKVGF